MKVQELIDNFLIAYITNDISECSRYLSDSISIQYSNIGYRTGKQQVLEALKWNEDFDVKHITTTNTLSYQTKNKTVTGLIAHHMVSYEKNNEMFPFIFGGKYVFITDTTDNLIEKINFVLEYQGENTIYMKGKWNFTESDIVYSALKPFNFSELYSHITCLITSEERIKQLCSLFFWLLDIGDLNTISQLISDDFTISREPYVGHTNFSANKDNLKSFIQATKNYYNLNQYSICFNNIYTDANDTVLDAAHLTPHRLGTKKRSYLTKYHSFFDEDVVIRLNAKEKIKSVIFTKSADVHYNGFQLLKY